MRDILRRLQPTDFDDIVAINALYRPGPLGSGMVDDFIDRKHGRTQITYPHPRPASRSSPRPTASSSTRSR